MVESAMATPTYLSISARRSRPQVGYFLPKLARVATCFVLLFSTAIAFFGSGCRRQSSSSVGQAQAHPKVAIAQRVVTLTPSLTEIVFSLGAGDRVVGVSDYCDYPAEAKTRARVGTFLQPSVEKILALEPSLVLLDGVQQDVAAALGHAGARVLAVPMNDLREVRAAITLVGEALGDRQPAAAQLLTTLDAELATVRQQVGSRPRKKVMFVVDRQLGGLRGLVVAGPGTYLDELLRLAGGENVFSDLKVRYAKVAIEAIQERQPAVILDAVHAEAGTEQAVRADWQPMTDLQAVRSGQVYVLGSREFVTPGPRLGQALRRLASLLQERP